MHHTQDPGKVSLMDGTQEANRLSMPEHIASGNAGTRYRRLLYRHCASLDLETAFKQIKNISKHSTGIVYRVSN